MERKSWDSYFMGIAEEIAGRSTCDRLNVGSVIVKGKRMVSAGYNGSLSNQSHCSDVGHLLNDQGRCIRTIHAEQNAIQFAKEDLNGATLYCTHEPCETCTKLIVSAGIKKVVFKYPYGHSQYNKEFTKDIEWINLSHPFHNNLFIISGHSGSGKSTIMKRIMKNEIVSVTTRPLRFQEIYGKDYYFVSKAEFDELDRTNKLIQKSSNYGHDYGVTFDEFNGRIKKSNCFVIVNYEGMQQWKKVVPDAVTIMLYSDFEATKRRLLNRNESDEVIMKRLASYEQELANRVHYDYVVKNIEDKLDDTISIIKKIISAETY